MTCQICLYPATFAHGRMICRWRRWGHAGVVRRRLAWSVACQKTADDFGRRRLEEWIERRARRARAAERRANTRKAGG